MVVATNTSVAIPGPRRMPGLGVRGNALAFMRDPLAALRRLHQTYGDIATLARGSSDYVFVFSPALNQQILSDAHRYYNADADTSPLHFPQHTAIARLSAGLVAMNGERHAQQRRLMLPAFHKQRVEAYHHEMVTVIEHHLAGWQLGDQRNLLDEMKQLTLAIALRTLLGLELSHDDLLLRSQTEQWMRLLFSPTALLVPLNVPGLPYQRLLTLAAGMERHFQNIIARRRASGGEGADALSLLIAAHDEDGARLSDAELVAQTATLFVASHITTASALTWTLFLLAQHPHTLASLLDELESAVQRAAPTVEQLGGLPLLDGVVKESLRLLPPFAWSMRINTERVELGSHALPAGAHIVFSPAITHRRSELYTEPQTFRPERWQARTPSPYEYLPFAAGPRMCLGASFALLEIKLAVALLVQRYRLVLPPDARVDYTGLTFLVPKHGLPVQIQPQDRRFSRSKVRGSIRTLVELD